MKWAQTQARTIRISYNRLRGDPIKVDGAKEDASLGLAQQLRAKSVHGREGHPGEASEVETLIVETKIEWLSGQRLYYG